MYNDDVKYRAIVHYEHFLHSLRKVAKIYGVSKSTVSRWVRIHGNPSRIKCRRPKNIALGIRARIKEIVEEGTCYTIDDFRTQLGNSGFKSLSSSSTHRHMHNAGVTRKRLSRTVNTDTISYDKYDDMRSLFSTKEQQIISIDETCFYMGDHPRYGYALRGKRARLLSHRKNMSRKKVTVILATSEHGVVDYKIIEGSCNTSVFTTFIQHMPVPKGSVLLMDNVAFHRSSQVSKCATDKGLTVFFTPPYSPWYNPVEYIFSMLKQKYRRLQASLLHDDECASKFIGNVKKILLEHCDASGCYDHVRRLLAI